MNQSTRWSKTYQNQDENESVINCNDSDYSDDEIFVLIPPETSKMCKGRLREAVNLLEISKEISQKTCLMVKRIQANVLIND